MEQKDNKKSLKERIQDSKTAERIIDISNIVVVIAGALFLAITVICILVEIGSFLFKLPNKVFFNLYVFTIFILIVSWIGYSFTSQKSELQNFFKLVLITIGGIVGFILVTMFIIALVVFVLAIGYAVWKINWLLLFLYVPFVIALSISMVCDVLDIDN